MDGGCVRSYYCECVLSNLLIESRKPRFAGIDARVSASRKSRVSRRTALFSLISFGFSAQARCARRELPSWIAFGAQRLLCEVLFVGRNFRRVEIGRSKEPTNTVIGSGVYRFRRSQCAAVTRDSRARIALRNDVKRGAGYCEPGNELRTELKSPCPNFAVSNPRG